MAIFLLGIKLLKGGVYTVLSGSMEPTYHVGSLLVVLPVDYKDIEIGDPITYALSSEVVVTHRVVGINSDENDSNALWFETQGDNNNTKDGSPVYYKNIIGKPIVSIPLLGYLITFMKSTIGTYITGLIIVILLLIGIKPMFERKRGDI